MIEVQCPSCQTRYRIDESVLPAQDSPTFKCSRCGHVFGGDPRLAKRAAAPKPRPAPAQFSAQSQTAPAPVQPRAPSGGLSQDAGAAADPPQPPQRAMQPPSTAPADSSGGFPRPPQSRPTSSAAAANTDYAPPPPSAPPQPSTRSPGPAPHRERVAAPSQPDNPLARSFTDEEPRTPDNLSFDFGDDAAEQHHLGDPAEASEAEDRYDRWRVGDPEAERVAPPPTPEMRRYQARRAALAQASLRVDRSAVASPDTEHGRARSSFFFLGLFALIVAGFGVLTFMLGISPSLSRTLLAQLPVIGNEFASAAPHPSVVSLSGVHAEYRTLDGHRRALIVSGQAENRGAEPLHTIQVGVSLVDSQQRALLSQSVFCGELVSPKIVSQMTPHELQFFQKLAPPKNFALKSGDSSPFFVMFINPPPNVTNFQVSILKAEPASGDAIASHGV